MKKQDKQKCDHDWAYDRGYLAQKRKCLLCERIEHRDYGSFNGHGPYLSNWYVKL